IFVNGQTKQTLILFQTPLGNARKYKNLGNEYFKKEKYDEAIIQYNKAIDICPKIKANANDLAIYYQNRAAANEQLKKYNDVKADCTKALELNPKYMKALLRRARALEQLGDLEAALDDLTTARIDEHFSNQTINAMADEISEKLVNQYVQENLENKKFIMPSKELIKMLMLSFPKDPVFSKLQHPENIPEFFKKPLQALKDKKYDDVIPLCTEIIQRPEFDTLPSSKLEVLLLRATFYIFLKKHDSAIQDLERILNSGNVSDGVKINALIKRGTLYAHQKNDLETAFKDFELAINIDPSYSEIYISEDCFSLIARVKNNIKYDKNTILSFQIYWNIGRFDKSTHDFDTAILYNPNFCTAYLGKYSNWYYFIKNVCGFFNTDCTVKLADETAKHIKRCFQFCPNISERSLCYRFYTELLFESRQYKLADTFVVKAIKEDPENACMHVRRAILQLRWKDDVDKAAEYLTKALELDERCDGAHEVLGNIAKRKYVSIEFFLIIHLSLNLRGFFNAIFISFILLYFYVNI
ncbi:PREDICTED: mitochondrial import receptor subunit TOM70-like, partial [Wasmannia auropunctata]|uniref:mitochondrial import receptor subunit TOM70-like n=1 Tax=Wasmannia auropunctata TaxID=64793 RepID=UPI0005EF38A3